ncbi:HAD family phosphatase [Candidatus Woesearchaeota archaeon]|nr:HAD family phosphatase [Candidatus Woesearchaeota archaeon]
MTIDAIFFDMDGLLVDSENLAVDVFIEIMARHNFSFSRLDIERYIFGRMLSESFEEVIVEHDLPFTSNVLLYEHRVVYNSRLQNVDALPYAYETIKLVKARYSKIALVSGSTQEQIDIVLDKLKLSDDFNIIINNEDVDSGKPSPKSYLVAAQTLNVDITKCVVLEDAAVGIEAANAAGAYSIGVKIGSKGTQDLTKAKYVVEFLNDIDWEYVEEYMKDRMASCKV